MSTTQIYKSFQVEYQNRNEDMPASLYSLSQSEFSW